MEISNNYDNINLITKTKMIFIYNALKMDGKLRKKTIRIFFQKITRVKKKFI